MVAILVFTIPAALVPVSAFDGRLKASMINDYRGWNASSIVFNTEYKERLVDAFALNNYVIVVTTKALYLVNTETMEVVANSSSLGGYIIDSDIDGGVLVLVSRNSSSTIVEYRDPVTLQVTESLSLPGTPMAVDASSGVVAVVSKNRSTLMLQALRGGEVLWEAYLPASRISVDSVYRAVVAVHPQGSMIALAVSATAGNGLVAVYSADGRLVLEDSVGRSSPGLGRVLGAVAWSPDGRLLYYYNGSSGNGYLVAVDSESLEAIWAVRAQPSSSIYVNPLGCCVYTYQPGSSSNLVAVDADSGRIIGSFAELSFLAPQGILGFSPTGTWILGFYRDARGYDIALYGALGSSLIRFAFPSPIEWQFPRGMARPYPEAGGWLSSGKFYIVQQYKDMVRVTIVNWDRFAQLRVETGRYSDYYNKIRGCDGQGACASGNPLLVVPGGPVSIDLRFEMKKPGSIVDTVHGLGWVIGNTSTLSGKVLAKSLDRVEPLKLYIINATGFIQGLWSHLILESWSQCPLAWVNISWTGGSLLVDKKAASIVFAAAPMEYRVEAQVVREKVLFGPVKPFTGSLVLEPNETKRVKAVPVALLGLTGGGSTTIYRVGGNALEEVSTEPSKWTYNCIAPGTYVIAARPSLGGVVLAPKGWSVNKTIHVEAGKEYRVNMSLLATSALARLIVVNDLDTPVVVKFINATYNGRTLPVPSPGYLVKPGSNQSFTLVAKWTYRLVWFPVGKTSEAKTVALILENPGSTLTYRIPSGQGETSKAQNTSPATQVSGQEESRPTTASSTSSNRTPVTSQPRYTGTAPEARGGQIDPVLGAGVAALVVIAVVVFVLSKRRA